MLGNVMEYCADKYDPEAYAKSGSSATDPLVTEGTEWVVRGGNYTSDAADLRCASRDYTKHEAWLKPIRNSRRVSGGTPISEESVSV